MFAQNTLGTLQAGAGRRLPVCRSVTLFRLPKSGSECWSTHPSPRHKRPTNTPSCPSAAQLNAPLHTSQQTQTIPEHSLKGPCTHPFTHSCYPLVDPLASPSVTHPGSVTVGSHGAPAGKSDGLRPRRSLAPGGLLPRCAQSRVCRVRVTCHACAAAASTMCMPRRAHQEQSAPATPLSHLHCLLLLSPALQLLRPPSRHQSPLPLPPPDCRQCSSRRTHLQSPRSSRRCWFTCCPALVPSLPGARPPRPGLRGRPVAGLGRSCRSCRTAGCCASSPARGSPTQPRSWPPTTPRPTSTKRCARRQGA
jgi:hypothetical protein